MPTGRVSRRSRCRSISIRQGLLTTANVRAEASGALGDNAATLALTVNARKPDGGAMMLPFTTPPTRINTIALTGKVAPTAEAIRLELVGQIAGLESGTVTIPGLGVSLAVEAKRDDPLAGGALPFALRIEADAVQTATGRIESVDGSPIILTADGTFDTKTAIGRDRRQACRCGWHRNLHRHGFVRGRGRQEYRGFRRSQAPITARRPAHFGGT